MKMSQLPRRVIPATRQFTDEDQAPAQKNKLKYDSSELIKAMNTWRTQEPK